MATCLIALAGCKKPVQTASAMGGNGQGNPKARRATPQPYPTSGTTYDLVGVWRVQSGAAVKIEFTKDSMLTETVLPAKVKGGTVTNKTVAHYKLDGHKLTVTAESISWSSNVPDAQKALDADNAKMKELLKKPHPQVMLVGWKDADDCSLSSLLPVKKGQPPKPLNMFLIRLKPEAK